MNQLLSNVVLRRRSGIFLIFSPCLCCFPRFIIFSFNFRKQGEKSQTEFLKDVIFGPSEKPQEGKRKKGGNKCALETPSFFSIFLREPTCVVSTFVHSKEEEEEDRNRNFRFPLTEKKTRKVS